MSCSGLRVFQKPQWFIKFKGQNLETNQEVISELKTLNRQLVVVTAIGSLRTGKSWILNRLAGCEPRNGFTVADGQSSVTKGIWIFCREHQHKENCIIVFLDTEGLHDPFKNDSSNEDNRLFIVAFLLCNVLIYNVSRKFDNNDLEKVGFITQISEKLQKSEAKKIYPEFILLVRDVTKLKLDGCDVDPDTYLNRVLTSGEQDISTLSPKTCILQNCTKRRCFSTTLPVDNFEDIDTLYQERVPLNKKYLKDEHVLKTYVLEEADVKRVSTNSPCTVKVFCGTIPTIVQIVQDGGIPTVTSIQHRVAEKENEALRSEVKNRFNTSLCDDRTNDSYASFKEKSSDLEYTCIQELSKNLVPANAEENQHFLQDFKNFADCRVKEVFSKKCEAERDACLEPILKNVFGNTYEPPNGEQEFQNDIETGHRRYKKRLKFYSNENEEIWKQKENDIRICRELLKLRDLAWQSEKKYDELEKREQEQKKQIEKHMKKLEQYKDLLDDQREERVSKRRGNNSSVGQILVEAFKFGTALTNACANFQEGQDGKTTGTPGGDIRKGGETVPEPIPKEPSESGTAI